MVRQSYAAIYAAAIVILVIAVLFGWLYAAHARDEEACERRGGFYHCPYKSECVCLDRSILR